MGTGLLSGCWLGFVCALSLSSRSMSRLLSTACVALALENDHVLFCFVCGTTVRVLCFFCFFCCVGTRYAASLLCSDVFTTPSAKWRSMIGIGMLPPLLILACLWLMPESPRWLIAKGRDAEALDVLKRVRSEHFFFVLLFVVLFGGRGWYWSCWYLMLMLDV